jgi:hypothetical protein
MAPPAFQGSTTSRCSPALVFPWATSDAKTRGRSGLFGSECRSAQRESDHFLTKRRRSDSVFTFTRFAAVIKHNVERIVIAKRVLKADHGC